MKKISLFFAAAAMLTVIVTGCEYLQDHKEKIHEEIIKYAESNGHEAAIAYVDQKVSEGKISKEKGDAIKTAIPLGIDKLKEKIKTDETK